MSVFKVDFQKTHSFSPFFLDYIQQKPTLSPFYQYFPTISEFGVAIRQKSNFPSASRSLLVTTLKRQYKNCKTSEKVTHNIQSLLDPGTFTITTGHQLNVLTGPLYFIYKIVTVINACKKLKASYPENNFVPVYWMASEDHDYEEIKSFRLYGQKYSWETDQKGAVGRFHPASLEVVLNSLPGDVDIFRKAYLENSTLADAARSYVNDLFQSEGLVVIDADDHDLKRTLQPVMKADIFQHSPQAVVNQSTEALNLLGYNTQVNAREINFFYLDKGLRSRIEKVKNGFKVIDTDILFSASQMQQTIESEPEKMSPNVILRPLYQEMILPNLAYIGGPTELVYWLQLKSAFDLFQIPMPILMPRNFALIMDSAAIRKLKKTGLEIEDLFNEKNYLFNDWTVKNSHHNLSLGTELEKLNTLFEEIKSRSSKIDVTMNKFIDAQATKSRHSLEHIEKKLLKAEKRLHRDKLNQIESLKDLLFPGGILQERTDNFLNFYQQNKNFVNTMIAIFDPFDFRFNVITE